MSNRDEQTILEQVQAAFDKAEKSGQEMYRPLPGCVLWGLPVVLLVTFIIYNVLLVKGILP